MEKKFIVNVLYGRRSVDVCLMMRSLMSCLYREHNINIIRVNEHNFQFETSNIIVKFINAPEKLLGVKADEIFGVGGEFRYRYLKQHNKEPYSGTILEYILEVEKGADTR